MPKDLKPGYYFLLASHDEQFSGANNVVSFTEVWVSKLAVVLRQQNPNTRFGGFVLDAASGEPVAGADVQVYAWNWNGQFVAGEKVRTDRNGLFSAQGIANCNNLLYVTHAGQALATANNLYVYNVFNSAGPAKANRLLHRPLALPPGADDLLQGHRHSRRSAERQLPGRAPRAAEHHLQRRQRQGDRPAERASATTTAR